LPRLPRYQLDKLAITPRENGRHATWTFARRPVAGVEHTFDVADGNFRARNSWQFVVRVPDDKGGRIEVRPLAVPDLKAWAELEDRSLTFTRATMAGYRGQLYCQVALADPKGEKTKDVIRGEERGALPKWFDPLRSRMRTKQTVRRTRANDGDQLVVLVKPADYDAMIGMFFATKVWVLKEKVTLDG
jgi:hypothetical protein